MHFSRLISAACVLTSMAACVTLAPGADKVRITNVAADVANCTALGNIEVSRGAEGHVDLANARAEFRDQTVALRGNTAFETEAALGVPLEGIAYRCPN